MNGSRKILLRGLINHGNYCYVHAVLQALLGIPHVIEIILDLADVEIPSNFPLTTALTSFVRKFVNSSKAGKVQESFIPTMIYDWATLFPIFNGGQQDAQEFLGELLTHFHEELSELWMFGLEKDGGLRNIFQMTVRTTLAKSGAQTSEQNESTFMLYLHIDRSHSLKEALAQFCKRQFLEGVLSADNKVIQTWQQQSLSKLPAVLILNEDSKGLVESTKVVKYPLYLNLNGNVLSDPKSKAAFRLRSVVYHDGDAIFSGHYLSDVRHENEWWRFNDSSLKKITEREVIQSTLLKVPYLLFYERM